MALTVDDFHPALDRRGNSELVRLIGELDHFRGTWRKMQEIRAERLVQLRQVTTIESTGSSTRIEGVELTDAEVARVLEGIGSDDVVLCCDLDAHVFNPEHTDPRVVVALAGTHWINVRELGR